MEPSPLHLARELAPEIRAHADEAERGRRLPPALVARMAEAGLFRICLPRELGGLDGDAAAMVEAIEETAKADGAAGWCLMVALTTSLLAGYLDDAAARAVFGAPGAIAGGVFAPRGAARVVDGGYRVGGRWPFASGCQHSSWLLGGSVILEGGRPKPGPGGAPETRMMLFPAADVTIHDTWHVAGLAGTGSHDIEVADVLVPASFSVSFFTDRPRRASPLHAFPPFGLLALGIAAVALGVARTAANELVRLADDKTPFGAKRTLGARPLVQSQIAEVEGLVRSARAFLFDAVGGAWRTALAGGEIPLERRAELRLAACHATASAARAVDVAYAAGGGSSIYASSPLQRCLRDVHVATQHVMVGPAIQELVGRVLAGIETDTSML